MAVSRTNNGPSEIHYEYNTTQESEGWTQEGLEIASIQLLENYQLVTIDLKDIPQTEHNTDLAIRFTFNGSTIMGNSGNARFNSFAVEGILLPEELITSLPAHPTKEKTHLIEGIFPNPKHSMLHIAFDELRWEDINSLEIINSQGVVLNKIDRVSGQHFSLMLEQLPPGIYSILVTSPTDMEVKRFIKL